LTAIIHTMAKQKDSAPEFVKYIGPVISSLHELGGSGRPDEVRTAIAKNLKISEAEQSIPLPSGVQSRFENQVHWARFYLAKGGYIDASRHGVWALTEKARALGDVSAARHRDRPEGGVERALGVERCWRDG
jgi:restriction system protein